MVDSDDEMALLRAQYQLPIAATCCYVALFYFLVGRQRSVKYALIEEYRGRGRSFDRYTSTDPRMTAADRALANTLEQTPAFLCGMWLHAVFVDPSVAGQLGLVWVTGRLVYPFLLSDTSGGLSLNNPKRVYCVTVPCYCIVIYLVSEVLASSFPSCGCGAWSFFGLGWIVFLVLSRVTPSTVV